MYPGAARICPMAETSTNMDVAVLNMLFVQNMRCEGHEEGGGGRGGGSMLLIYLYVF